MDIKNNNNVDMFINEVCTYIKLKEVHKQIRLELENHIDEGIEEYLENGFNQEESIKKAIANMGNAETIGKQLNKAHKDSPEWSLVALSVFFSFIGISLMYLLQTKVGLRYTYGHMFYKTLSYFLIGIVIMISFYIIDYRKFENYSKYLFIAVIPLTIFIESLSDGVNNIYRIGIDFTEITLFLFIISLSGIFCSYKIHKGKKILYSFFLFIIPELFFLKILSLAAVITYAAAFLVLLQTSKFKLKLRYIVAGIFIILISCTFYFEKFSPYYMKARMFSFLFPYKDPSKCYLYELIHASCPFGGGFALSLNSVPELHTDFIFVYIIYAFGWASAFILTLLILFFIIRLFKSANKVKDNYGKLLIKGLASIFAMKFFWNILMILGFAPIAGISMPFISYGGSSVILSMASIGVIISVYKRRSIENIILEEK